MNSQKDVAARLLSKLTGSGKFASISLAGSIAEGNWDSYSDIDIVLESPDMEPFDVVNSAFSILSEHFDIWFTDWARSLLPNKYVLSVFLRAHPIFWYVDLTAYSNPSLPGKSRNEIQQDKTYHYFKLWLCNAKQQLRSNHERNLVDTMYSRLFDDNTSKLSNVTKFERTLKWLSSNSEDAALLQECDIILQHMKKLECGR